MFSNITHAFTAGSQFLMIWIVVMLIMAWSIGGLRHEFSLYQGDLPSEARALRKKWALGTLYVLGPMGIIGFGVIVHLFLNKA